MTSPTSHGRTETRPSVFLQTGFRPFFLLAAGWAAFAMGWWGLFLGRLVPVSTSLQPVDWHAHEMIFGYATAVLAGFFLTATRNWTKRPTASGLGLLSLVVLWALGRVGGVFSGTLGVLADVTFLVGLAAVIALPIVQARSKRNYGFPILLLVLAVADALSHLTVHTQLAARIGLDAILVILVIFGGRVVPMFTRNAMREANVTMSPRWDTAARWLVWAFLISEIVSVWVEPVHWLAGALAVAAGLASLIRSRNWRFFATLGSPIVWILHLGFAWIGLGLIVRGATLLGAALPSSLGTHALTVGAIGTLTLAMLTRVALGHTGRAMRAPRTIVVAYGLLTLAVILRLASPWLPPWGMLAAAFSFFAAFAIYFVVYLPILVSARPDGKPG
ncbi:MAG: hypothetical protein ACI9MC_002943 [Kiritimatiellia bacterium]|jgi:uncharacterized protein involved in response to NO